MQYNRRWWRIMLLAGFVALGLLTIFRISSAARSEPDPIAQQDVIRLETRINQLEQRLYTIDSSLRNLEQQSRLAGATSRGLSQEDLARLLLEIQTLQRRLIDDECGLAKLDERTLAPAVREARRKSGAGRSDPCRLNFDAPLRLPDSR
jgi:hypothetical protein